MKTGLWKVTFGHDTSDNWQADFVLANTAEEAIERARAAVEEVNEANEEEVEFFLTGVALIGRETIAP